jgi:hypothetical protein
MLALLRRRLDSWPIIVTFGLLYFSSQMLIYRVVRDLGTDMLLAQVSLSAEEVRAIFDHWQEVGLLPVYAAHYRYDMIHPLWYSVLLAAMLAKAFNARGLSSAWNACLLLPFVAGACDLFENTMHRRFIVAPELITESNVRLANGAAITKWSLVAVVLLALPLLLVPTWRRRGVAV